MKFYFLTFLALISCLYGTEFYVSVNGNDANPGTLQAPFATLKQARNAIRALKQNGQFNSPMTVTVLEGVYELQEPFELTKEDSGKPDMPIVYRAQPGKKVYLIGGKTVLGFEPYRSGILKADLAKQGLADKRIKVLVFNGRRQELARYPNHDPDDLNGGRWAYVDGQRVDMYAQMPFDEDDYYKTHQHLDFWQRNLPRLTRTLKMKAEDVRDWKRPSDGQVSIFPRFNWWHYILDIESYDVATRTLRLGPGNFYEIRPGDRYFVRGIFEELDSPGEWFHDRAENTLYFWPPAERGQNAVYVATLDNIATFQQCAYVEFRGFVIECANSTAIQLKDCQSCLIGGNVIRNVGDAPNLAVSHFEASAVSVEGGRDNRIVGNDIAYVGGYGIYLGGGNKETLALGNNVAENNIIHHVGLIDRKAKGVEVVGAGNAVRHNWIYHIPQSGVYIWGSKHLIEYNHIHHTCLEGEDTGAIGGGNIDWLSWHGVVLRYNFIHDTIGFGFDQQTGRWKSPHFTWAIYADWAPAGVEIVGNILARAPNGLIHIHCGRNNRVENNILIDGQESQIFWSGWNTATGFWSTKVQEWTENYKKAIRSDAWRAVPTMVDPAVVPLPNGQLMYDNVFVRNIVYFRPAGAMLYLTCKLPLECNVFDQNLIYHFGAPLSTGILQAEEALGDNLLANGDLEKGPLGGLPADWPPVETGKAVSVAVSDAQAHSGRLALRIDPGEQNPDHKAIRLFYFPVASAPYVSGKTYLLEGWIKTESQTPRAVEIISFHWKISKTILVDKQWRRFEFVFQIPAEAQALYEPNKSIFSSLLVFQAGTGVFWLDDVCLKEVRPRDGWQTWLALDKDRHSIVSDPLFVDPDKDDYRLKPDSPAFRLGFKPIPIEKIGPYQHPLRASWPIDQPPHRRK